MVNVAVPLSEAPAALINLIIKRSEPPPSASEESEPARNYQASSDNSEAVRRYALAALDNQTKSVESAGPGTRNQALNNAALSLGHLVGAGALTEHTVRAALEGACTTNGLIKDDGIASVRATISSGLKAGIAQAADLSKIGQRARPRRPQSGPANPRSSEWRTSQAQHGGRDGDADVVGEQLNRRLAAFKLTDVGNVERFLARYCEAFRWCPAIGWLAWTGKVWSSVGAEGLGVIATHKTVRAIVNEAAAIEGTEDDFEVAKGKMRSEQVAAWGVTSEGARHFGCILKNAAGYLEVQASALDSDLMRVNVNNGTLVIRKRDDGSPYIALQPHNPKDLCTKIAPIDYDPIATCPTYDSFLAKVQPEPAMRRFLHQWAGLSLTGDTTEESMAIFYGVGANGKSTWLESLAYVVGQYAGSSSVETFLEHKHKRRGDQASPDVTRLAGVRFLRTSEPESGARLAEAFVKWITGGDMITARHLNRAEFEFKPQFKLIMSGNHKPVVRGVDKGIWRRIRLVPWDVTIPEDERDKTLKSKLLTEGSGILNRLLDGLVDWLDNGLIVPEEVTTATAKYREDSDTLGRFLAACTKASPGSRVQSSRLFAVFRAWANQNGVDEWTQNGFSAAMLDHSFAKAKAHGVMLWDGLELIPEVVKALAPEEML
jgi:putative DNA primase/helicase